jgi:predicted DNA-binding WGR domain protein
MTKATRDAIDARTETALKASLIPQILKQSQLKNPSHTLIHIEDPHYKFYQLKIVGTSLHTCFGRIGTTGQLHTSEEFGSFTGVMEELTRTLRAKLNKGYEEPLPVKVGFISPKKKVPKKLTAEGLEKLDAFLNSLK